MTLDAQTLEDLRRGLLQEITAMENALRGKRRQVKAIERHLGVPPVLAGEMVRLESGVVDNQPRRV